MTEVKNTELAGLSFHSTSTYVLLEEIGRGGRGIIFLAEKNNEGVKDKVVLKTIKTLSKEHEERLKHEANIATGLRHENIVKTYGLESIPLSLVPESFRKEIDAPISRRLAGPMGHFRLFGGQVSPLGRVMGPKYYQQRLLSASKLKHKIDGPKLFFIAMDYVPGADLHTLHCRHLQKKMLFPCELAGFIVSRICRAMAYAHQFIIHRDISPENILVNNHGVCKLSDFGVAAQTREEMELLAGKLGYMSPEQINQQAPILPGQEIDSRTDIFSLGLVAYELLTGVVLYNQSLAKPFEEQRRFVIEQMQKEIIPPHRVRSDIPEGLSLIVMKMLAKDKNKRYLNMYDVGDVLEQRYLYAKGFGPTNNSLAAYLEIFDADFKKYNQEQLRQLNFLKGPDGKLNLCRQIKPR